jgi:hypothetical protein
VVASGAVDLLVFIIGASFHQGNETQDSGGTLFS